MKNKSLLISEMEIRFDKIKPVKFHPYPSYVTNRIFECERNKITYEIQEELIELFNENDIKAWKDNKIVFEVNIENTNFFIGFYDFTFSIGVKNA